MRIFWNRDFFVDLINMFLGIAVITLTALSFMGETIQYICMPIIFASGAAMLGLNSFKMMSSYKVLSFCFLVGTIILSAATVVSLLDLFV